MQGQNNGGSGMMSFENLNSILTAISSFIIFVGLAGDGFSSLLYTIPLCLVFIVGSVLVFSFADKDNAINEVNNDNSGIRDEQPDNDQDPYAYHGTEKYDAHYNLREDEYCEEYGDDFEDAIDDRYEEKYRKKR